jgi:acyl-CoA thioester hydrolase
MPAIHFETFQARYYECDAFGSLKFCNYLCWMQEAAFAASAAVGYDFSRYTEIGNLWLVRGTKIQFVRTLNYGDEVEIKTWVEDFRRFRSNRAYEFWMKNSGQLMAKATTDWVFLDPSTLKPV